MQAPTRIAGGWIPYYLALVAVLGSYGSAQAKSSQIAVYNLVLDNGLTVIVGECPGSVTVSCSAFVGVSALEEQSLTAGIRRLIQLIVTAQAQTAGGELLAIKVDGSTTRDYVELIMQCLPEDFAAGLQWLQQRLFECEFGARELVMARQSLRRSLAVGDELPITRALDTLVARLYPAQVGSWPAQGTFAAAGAMRLEEVRSFYQRHFLPNATTIVVTGPLRRRTVAVRVREVFGALLPGQVKRRVAAFVPQSNLPRRWRGQALGGGSSIVVFGGKAPTVTSDDYPAAAVLSTLLGSGMGSRLYRTLREQRAMSYITAAELTPSQVCSYAYVLASCAAADVDMVEQLINEELQDIAEHGPAAQELQRAKRYLRGSFALNQQSSRELAHYLGMFAASGGLAGLETHQQFPELIAAVQSKDVQEVCRSIFGSPVIVILEAPGTASSVRSGKQISSLLRQ